MRIVFLNFVVPLSLVLFNPAFGADGVREINQACVVSADGCFAGDGVGFPVEITESGSYVLTSNLTVLGTTGGIELNAADVTIDFNGFTLAGPVACEGDGDSLSCTPDCFVNSGRGVGFIFPASPQRVTVRNGSVRGFTTGVMAGAYARIESLSASENSCTGVFLSQGSIVNRSNSSRNGTTGIGGSTSVLDGFLILDSVAVANGEFGINLPAATIRGNLVGRNGKTGIRGGSSIVGNTVYFNSEHGINAGGTAVVANNSVSGNTEDQIRLTTAGAGIVIGNTASNSSPIGSGLNLSDNVSFINNAIKGTVTGGVDVSGNLCNGDPCP